MSRIVIALGGNALQANPKDTTAEAQLITAGQTSETIVDLIEEGHEVIIAHGNGPQVGQLVATYEAAASINENSPVMPFPECGAMSQGYIGYHLQQSIRAEMRKRGINKEVATVITQVIVDANDPGFKNPTKPVGSFFTQEQANKLMTEKGYTMKEDSNRGWRRVVASPLPIDIVEKPIIKTLVDAGHIVITVGGGGIPVIDMGNGNLKGVPAVIDKDFASCKIAELINADLLVVLTAVEQVAINFGKPNQKNLSKITVEEAKTYMKEGQFAPGSMLPKIKAALIFVEAKEGRKAIITSLEKAKDAIREVAGTIITK
ncbi:carbamate kinase [Clostridium estertheticum]|uniref:Carbamate kinase n=2 Tax=Clostridium estertheticum TaxID=238834 RepID=A0A1J0GKS9_9CLOT|nr:carbamate kinase [Clostridium estertheticum]APC41568.1 carbamate kinase [Clostridium estertheticum subsp. estertheticum]MBZ9616570.1 carbamate kinase [Clostridium estertheticum subsp. laramiense]MCB2341745.1 carbamate kinase [Clostridium estertheticum]MPQ32878.1 carbamate kinase [Clostridium estertheticum]MPQ63537.1 carbamate kinase [Clostridium estertheticum]